MRDSTLLPGGFDHGVSRALSNPNRQRLLDIVTSRDYVSTTELLAESGLGWGTLLYHLDILIRAGLVGSSLAGKKRFYFRRRGEAPPQPITLEKLKSPNLSRLIDALLAQRGRCQHELQEATGLSQRMCSYYLQKLQERGFVLRQADGNRARYHPTDRLLTVFASAPTGGTEAAASAAPVRVMGGTELVR